MTCCLKVTRKWEAVYDSSTSCIFLNYIFDAKLPIIKKKSAGNWSLGIIAGDKSSPKNEFLQKHDNVSLFKLGALNT